MNAPSVLRICTTWQLDWGPLLLASASGTLYLVGVKRVRRWQHWRTITFLSGLGALLFALESGLDVYSDRLLSVHMVEHLILALVAAPLLLAGAPITLILRATSQPSRRIIAGILQTRLFGWFNHPIIGLLVIGGSMLVTHFTGLYSLALRDDTVHACEHLLYLGCGMCFWVVLISPGPPARQLDSLMQVVYLLLAMPLMSVVGVVLACDLTPRYSEYLKSARAFGISALHDQHLAGVVMWLGGTGLMGVVALCIIWRSMVVEERRAGVHDAHTGALTSMVSLAE